MTTRDVTFKTYDGLKLAGTLYPAGEKSPCVIMTCGYGGDRTDFLPDFAKRFQAVGITVLAYDNRCWGDSEGTPRFEVDPVLQSRDYHDAFCYASTLPEVDADKIVYWGTSFAGGTATYAAVLNKKLAAVIIQAPFMSGEWVSRTSGESPIGLIFERGYATATGTPAMVPVFLSSREGLESGQSKAVLQDPASLPFVDEMRPRGYNLAKSSTVQSMANTAMFEPMAYIHRVSPTPLLMVAAGNDNTTPTHLQLEAFARAREPKTLQLFPAEDHFSIYWGQPFEENVKVQIEFLRRTLKLT